MHLIHAISYNTSVFKCDYCGAVILAIIWFYSLMLYLIIMSSDCKTSDEISDYLGLLEDIDKKSQIKGFQDPYPRLDGEFKFVSY
jgi:hypothetical protein